MARTNQAKKSKQKSRKTAPVEPPSSDSSIDEPEPLRSGGQRSPLRRSSQRSPQRRSTQRSPQRQQPQRSPQRQQPQRSPQRPAQNSSRAQQQTAATSSRAKTNEPVKGAKKRKQTAPVLRDIRKLQSTTDPLIPRAPFLRLIREILQKFQPVSREAFRITPEAIEALRETTENHITGILGQSYLITLSRKQVTLQPRDVQLLFRLIGPNNSY